MAGPADTAKTVQKLALRLQADFMLSAPMGQFSAAGSNRFYAGQSLPSSGFAFTMDYPATDRIRVGLMLSDVSYSVDAGKFASQLRSKYAQPGYYTTVQLLHPVYEVGSIGLTASYKLSLGWADAEPYIVLGTAFGGSGM
jgi:hypothetical protein